jgi:hypothetical protein
VDRSSAAAAKLAATRQLTRVTRATALAYVCLGHRSVMSAIRPLGGWFAQNRSLHVYELDSGFQSRNKMALVASLGPDEICERYRNAN